VSAPRGAAGNRPGALPPDPRDIWKQEKGKVGAGRDRAAERPVAGAMIQPDPPLAGPGAWAGFWRRIGVKSSLAAGLA